MLNEGCILDETGIPVSIRIFKVGDNRAPDTTCPNVVYDPADAERVMAANNRGDGKIVFDFGHSTLDPDKPGDHVGIGDYVADDTGVWAHNIKWQPEALHALKMGTLRYFSPGFKVVKSTDGSPPKIGNCLSVALTNVPATEGSLPIIRTVDTQQTVVSSRRSSPAPKATPKENHRVDFPKRTIKKINGKYRLVSKTGKNLGDFDTYKQAAKHEGEVEYFKAHPKRNAIVRPKTMTDEEKLKLAQREDIGDESKEDEWDDEDGEVDLEGMDIDALREFGAKAMDKIRDLKKATDDGEDGADGEEEEDDEEKRSVVNAAWRTGLISFVQKAQFMKLTLSAVRTALAKVSPTARTSVERPTTVKRAPTSASKNRFIELRDPNEYGMTDEELTEALQTVVDPATLARHGLNISQPDKVWGNRLDSYRGPNQQPTVVRRLVTRSA